MCRMLFIVGIACAVLGCGGEATSVPEVVGADWHKGENGTYTFRVSLRHDDTGWEHYADRWVIENRRGKELARRVLRHPHVDEQPFTRALEGVRLPTGTHTVIVRGHCSRHGYGPPFELSLAD